MIQEKLTQLATNFYVILFCHLELDIAHKLYAYNSWEVGSHMHSPQIMRFPKHLPVQADGMLRSIQNNSYAADNMLTYTW